MDVLITDSLLNVLLISITFSIVQMAFVQKFKKLSCVNKNCHIWIINFLSSFLLGIPFSIWFYDLNIYNALWVCVFGFIGAPSLYQTLKKQNIINYTPDSLKNNITISKENEIKRD